MTAAPDYPLRLSGVPSIRLRDEDEYGGYVEQLKADLELIRSRGDFEFSGQFVSMDGFGVSVGHWGSRTLLHAQMSNYTVSFPLRGLALVPNCGRIEHRERALILGARGAELSIDLGDNFSNIALSFEPTVIRDHLRALVGVERVEFALEPEIDLRTGSGMYLQRLAHVIVAEIQCRPEQRSVPGGLAGLREGFIHALLATQVRSSAFERPTLDVGERRVQELESYIQEHLDGELTLGELAAEVGVSVRAVQLAFRRYRGQSPAEFIRARRLERAAKLLRVGGASVTVLDVALDCGFSHTGRFARSYCERFGELPSETLRNRGRVSR